jgi:hypothetical protein
MIGGKGKKHHHLISFAVSVSSVCCPFLFPVLPASLLDDSTCEDYQRALENES